MIFPVKRLADLGFGSWPPTGTARGAAPARRRRPRSCASYFEARPGRRCVERILAGERRPGHQHPVRARATPGRGSTATRSAPRRSRPGIPCITTVQGAGGGGAGHRGAAAGRDRACARCRSCTPQLRRGGTGDGGVVGAARSRSPSGASRCRWSARCSAAAGSVPTTELEIAAGGIAERFRPGQFVARRRRRAGLGAAAAPVVRDLPGDAGRRVRRHRADRGRRARRAAPRGWPAAGRATPLDVVGPLGHAVPAARPRGRLPAGRRRLRRGAAVLARRRAARPAAAGSTSCSGPPRRTGCSASWRPADRRQRWRSDHRRRLAGRRGRVDRRAAGEHRADRARPRSTPAGRWGCCARSARSPPRTGCPCRWRSRSRWPAGSGCA